jgi:hypothetical protein
MPHHYQSVQDFFLLRSQADGQEGAVQGVPGDVVDQTTALEEGALTMNAATIVFAAFAHIDDATLGCVSESRFDAAELPFEVFNCHHPGSMFCNISISGWPPHGLKPSPLEID